MLTPKQLVTTQIIVFYSFQKSENKVFKYRNCPTDFSCWLNWSTEIENSFQQNPQKRAWHFGTGLGGVREGKNQHYNNIVAPQQLQQKYQPRFQGSLPPVPAEQERGRRENQGTRL